MAQSNDILNTHIVRLRFFRFLVVACLLLLAICALQMPFGGPGEQAGQGTNVTAQSVKGIATNRSKPEPGEQPHPSPVETKASSAAAHSGSGSGAGAVATTNDPAAQGDAELPFVGPAMDGQSEGMTAALDREIAKNGHVGSLVFDMASNAGWQIGETSQVTPALPKLPLGWLAGPPRKSPRRPTVKAKPPTPKPTAIREDPPQPQRVAAAAKPAPVSPEPPAAKPTAARVVLLNPPQTQVALHFLVNGEAHTLAAGARYELRGDADGWAIQFHPGGERDDIHYYLTRGAYLFGASHDGWMLVKAEEAGE